MRLLQEETAHSFYGGKQRHQSELDWSPAAPFSFFKHKFVLLDRKSRHWFDGIEGYGKFFGGGGRAFSERIVRTNQFRSYLRIFNLHRDHLPAFDRARGSRGIVCIERKCSVGAAKVGSSHARERLSLSRHRRKIRGNAKDGIRHAMLVENL